MSAPKDDDPEYPSGINAATDFEEELHNALDKSPAAFAGYVDGDKVRIDVYVQSSAEILRVWITPEKAKAFGEGMIRAHDIIKGLTAKPLGLGGRAS